MRDPECYQKIKVPAFFLLRSKLVDVKLRWFDLFKVDSDDSKPKLFHINHVEVEHGLIVTKDEDQPEGLKVSGWKYERLFSAKSSLITRIA